MAEYQLCHGGSAQVSPHAATIIIASFPLPCAAMIVEVQGRSLGTRLCCYPV